MKYKDYYQVLGIGHDVTTDEIKKAYRKLAHQFHPDISTDPGESKFKEIAEAYKTLKDPQKRAAYDQLGHHPSGQEFEPPPAWEQQFGGEAFSFNDIDLADLFVLALSPPTTRRKARRHDAYSRSRRGHRDDLPGRRRIAAP